MLNKKLFKKDLGRVLSPFGKIDYNGDDYITFQSGHYKMKIFFQEVVFNNKQIILHARTGNTFYCKNKNKEQLVRYGNFLEFEIGTLKDGKVHTSSGILDLAKEVVNTIHILKAHKIKK